MKKKRKQDELTKQEEDKKLAEAAELEKSGDTEAAQAVLEKEIITPKVETVKIKMSYGLSARRVWKYRIIDINKIPREYMIPDHSNIGATVRAEKNKTNIPGIEAYSETTAY